MRLIPALFGVGLVILPWLWRKQLGTVGVMVCSLFLAVSPLQTAVSRTAGGDSPALFAILLLVISLYHFRDSGKNGWLYTAAVALAIGLTSTTLFYSGLLTFGVAYFVYRKIGVPIFADDDPVEITAQIRQTAVIITVAVFGAISTLFLWYPAGIGTVATLPAMWIQQFNFANIAQIADPFLIILRYEPGLIILTMLAMGWITWRNHALGSLLIFWFATVALITLLQPGASGNALLFILPSALLVGLWSNSQISPRWDGVTLTATAGGVVFLMLILVNLTRFLRVAAFNPTDLEQPLTIVLGLLLAVSALFLLASWDIDYVTQAGLLSLLICITFYSWGTAWWLGNEGKHDPRERWVTSATDDDARYLFPVIKELSRQATNSTADLTILSLVDTPVLRWYLRDYTQVEFADTLPSPTVSDLIITPENSELTLPTDYLGSDYGLIRPKPELIVTETIISDTLKWWFFQESITPINEERVIIWLRSDLAQE
jgi:hypothetical protein